MSTLLLDRGAPAGTGRPAGGNPARRAIVRWAWRLFRREWRQQLLVLGLLTAAVAATTVAAAAATNVPPSPDAATFGTANHLVTLPGSDPRLGSDIAAIRGHFGSVDVIENSVLGTGSVTTAQLRAQDPGGQYGRPLLALVAGRYPAVPDQVAMTSQLASQLGLRLGDVWHGSNGASRRVVGLVQNPENLLDQFALVRPGELAAPDEVTVMFDATAARVAHYAFPGGARPQARSGQHRAVAATTLVLALATLGLIFIGLVAVGGFTVMAQRRLRGIGMLGALGATDRNIRLVLLANGAVVGAAGAVAGAGIGVTAWIAFGPDFQNLAGHTIDRFALPWWLVGTSMALAVVTSVVAAWWPARAAARLPVMAALSGRPASPRPARRLAMLGVLLLAAGLGFMTFADDNGGVPPLLVGGLVGTTLGVALIGPAVIAALAAAGRRAPIAVRLALRDLGRYRARSGAALAAVSLAAGFAAIIAIAITQHGTQSAQAAPAGPNLPANQLIFYVAPELPPAGQGNLPQLTRAERQALHARVSALATSLHATDVLTLDAAVDHVAATYSPAQGNSPAGWSPAGLVKPISSCPAPGAEYAGQVYVATPAVLRHYRIKSGSIGPATDLLSSRADLGGVRLASAAFGPGCSYSSGVRYISRPSIRSVGLPAYSSDPNTLISTGALHRLGWRSVPAGWLIQTRGPLTAGQISAARQAAAAVGGAIEVRTGRLSLSQVSELITAAGLLLALGVLAMTVGLIRSETAGDLRTLTATGAGGRTRRILAATTACALALLGALIGIGVSYLAAIAWYRANIDTLANVPLASLLIVLIGLPAAAAAGGWLLGGREPQAIARQPLAG